MIPSLYTKMYNGHISEIAGRVSTMKKYVLNSIQPLAFAMDISSCAFLIRKISKLHNKLIGQF